MPQRKLDGTMWERSSDAPTAPSITATPLGAGGFRGGAFDGPAGLDTSADPQLVQAFRGLVADDPPPPVTAVPCDLPILLDGAGAVITAGTRGYLMVNFPCVITGWTLLSDVIGSLVVDVLRSTFATFPTFASIAGTSLPTLSSAQKAHDLTLTDWGATTLNRGDILRFDATGTPASVTLVLLDLRVRRLDLTAQT